MQITFLRPIDQFYGARRFLDELKTCLQSNDLDELYFSVAFAKVGPLMRLEPYFQAWSDQGKLITAIFGIDVLGTSAQALRFALQAFSAVYVLHTDTHATFHPKFYLYSGAKRAVIFQGSHNLTVGGTETNLEGGVRIDLQRPPDENTYQEALSVWTSLLPDRCAMTVQLTEPLIDALLADKIIFDENAVTPRTAKGDVVSPDGSPAPTTALRQTAGVFQRVYPKPPSAIPKASLDAQQPPKVQPTAPTTAQPNPASMPTVATEALVIQIVPHHNGEVFLSKNAINQNPGFFGFPFTGMTTPKFAHNASYPQRVPDPVVNVTVYDSDGNPVLTKIGFAMNTVFYATKSEIRVTFSPDLRDATAPYSIMVMRRTEEAHDYDIDIFNPGTPPSPRYAAYLAACNQQLPSGGSGQARRMGWL